jgi:hypothetical protein
MSSRLTDSFISPHSSSDRLHPDDLADLLRSGLSDDTRVTPAMEAGLTDHVWSIAEMVGLLSR